jgi:hypothetical protein
MVDPSQIDTLPQASFNALLNQIALVDTSKMSANELATFTELVKAINARRIRELGAPLEITIAKSAGDFALWLIGGLILGFLMSK